MVVTFKKPVDDRGRSHQCQRARLYQRRAASTPTAVSIRIALARKVKVNSIPAAERLYVDLLPETWSGMHARSAAGGGRASSPAARSRPSASCVSSGSPPRARSRRRSASRSRASRPSPATCSRCRTPPMSCPNAPTESSRSNFDQPIKWDLADAKAALPPTLESIEADIDDDSVAVSFALNGTPEVRTFREDRSIVVDVGHDGAKPKAAAAQAKRRGAAMPKQAAAAPLPRRRIAAARDRARARMPPATATSRRMSAAPRRPSQPRCRAAAAATPPKIAAAPAPPAPHRQPAADRRSDAPPAAAPAAAPNAGRRRLRRNSLRNPPRPNASGRRPIRTRAVVVELQQSGGLLRAEFPFAVDDAGRRVPRADMLWLVFDSAAKIDLAALTADAGHAIRNAALERGADGEAIVRIKLERPRLVSLEADGPGWIVTIGDTVTVPSRPLVIARNIVGKNRASIAIPFDDPRKIHRLSRPRHRRPAAGDHRARARARIPQGARISSNCARCRPPKAWCCSRSPTTSLPSSRSTRSPSPGRAGSRSRRRRSARRQQLASNLRALDLRHPALGPRPSGQVQRPASRTDPDRRHGARQPSAKQARLNLARFYLARDMSAEAKAVLNVALADQKDDEDVTGTVLKGGRRCHARSARRGAQGHCPIR